MTVADIIAAARACLDTPFVHQGRIPGRALDCAGLVVAVANAVGAEVVDVPGYGRTPSNGMLEDALERQPAMRRVDDRQPGDILLMRFSGEPQHLAILAGETLIHSYANVGKVCEHRFSDVWRARVVRVYRFKEMA